MDRILKGIMKYREIGLNTMVKQFQQVRDNPMVSLNVYKLTQKSYFVRNNVIIVYSVGKRERSLTYGTRKLIFYNVFACIL